MQNGITLAPSLTPSGISLTLPKALEVAAPVQAKPKPKRVRKPAAAAVGAGVTVLGDRFVCSYSGEIRDRAIFVADIPTVCFANLPCAFAWLSSNVQDATALADIKTKLCEVYEQPSVEGVLCPPDRSQLSDFGGSQVYSEWIGELVFWDTHAQISGTSVADWKKSAKKTTATKKAKAAQARVTFETGVYSVGIGGAAKCKRVTHVDGDDKLTGKDITAIKSMRKLTKFAASSKLKLVSECKVNVEDGYTIFFHREREEEPGAVIKEHNHIATQMAGVNAVGPALVFALRKTSVKI